MTNIHLKFALDAYLLIENHEFYMWIAYNYSCYCSETSPKPHKTTPFWIQSLNPKFAWLLVIILLGEIIGYYFLCQLAYRPFHATTHIATVFVKNCCENCCFHIKLLEKSLQLQEKAVVCIAVSVVVCEGVNKKSQPALIHTWTSWCSTRYLARWSLLPVSILTTPPGRSDVSKTWNINYQSNISTTDLT